MRESCRLDNSVAISLKISAVGANLNYVTPIRADYARKLPFPSRSAVCSGNLTISRLIHLVAANYFQLLSIASLGGFRVRAPSGWTKFEEWKSVFHT